MRQRQFHAFQQSQLNDLDLLLWQEWPSTIRCSRRQQLINQRALLPPMPNGAMALMDLSQANRDQVVHLVNGEQSLGRCQTSH